MRCCSKKSNVSLEISASRVAADIESGVIDKLTLAVGRQRYQCGDSVTRRLQVDLVKQGLLVQAGRRYQVAA